jgi:hypothetical protein
MHGADRRVREGLGVEACCILGLTIVPTADRFLGWRPRSTLHSAPAKAGRNARFIRPAR